METVELVIKVGALLAAIGTIVTFAYKLFKWVEHQKEQDERVDKLEVDMKAEFQEIRTKHSVDQKVIQEEQMLIVYGLLACFDVLDARGIGGSVADAFEKLNKYLNKSAHKTS